MACNTSALWQTPRERYAATDRNLFMGWCCSQNLLDNTSCFLTGWLLISSNWQPPPRSCCVCAESRAAERLRQGLSLLAESTIAWLALSLAWLLVQKQPEGSFWSIFAFRVHSPLQHTLTSATGDTFPYSGHELKINTCIYYLFFSLGSSQLQNTDVTRNFFIL